MKRITTIAALVAFLLAASAVSAIAQEQTDKYELVTDASTLAAGDTIIIVGISGNKTKGAISTTQNTNNRTSALFSFNADGTITPPSDVAIIVLGGVKGKWTLYVSNGPTQGYLCAANSHNNHMKTRSDVTSNAQASITIGKSGVATIKFQGSYKNNTIMFNSSSSLFSCYLETSDNVSKPYIYRKPKQTTGKGDINHDGQVTIADVTSLVNIILGKASSETSDEHEAAADLNGDGSITIADVTSLVNIILGK